MNDNFTVNSLLKLKEIVTGPLRRVRAGMKQTERGSASLGSKFASLTKKMAPIAAGGALILAVMTGTAMATVETQKALGELASVGVTDMKALEAAGTDFSNQFAGTDKAAFISAAYDIKSGISTLSDVGVAEFTKLAALTGKATKSTTAEMTSLFATGYGIYKQQYENLTDLEFGEVFSASIAASVQSFKTTGSQMAAAISSIGASATNANVPLHEQLTILGMLQATMSGSEAGTKYKAFINSSAEAGGKLGLSFMTAENQLKSMPEILSAIRSKYGATLDAIEKVELKKAFGTEEAIGVIDLMYNRIDTLKTNMVNLQSAQAQGASFTQKMAQTMNKDLGASMQIAGQQMHNLVEIIGGMFAPSLTWIIQKGSGVILFLQKLANWVSGSSIAKGFLSIVGVISMVVVGFTAFTAAGAGIAMLIPYLTASLAPLAVGLAAISWPVWIVIGAIGALYFAWRNNFGGMADTVSSWWNTISLVFRGVKALFATLKGTTGVIEGELAKDIKAAGLVGLVVTVGKVVYRIGQLFAGIGEGLSVSIGYVSDAFEPVINTMMIAVRPLGKIFLAVGTAIGWAAGKMFGFSASTDASKWRVVGQFIGFFVAGAFKLLGWAINIALIPLHIILRVAGLAMSIFVGFGKIIGNFVGWIVTGFEKVTNFLSSINLFETGAKILGTLSEGIKSTLMRPVELVKSGFQKLRNMLPFSDAKEGPLSQLTLSGSKIMDTLGLGIKKAAPALAGVAAMALAGISDVTSNINLNSPKSIDGQKAAQVKAKETDSGKKIIIQQLTVKLDNVASGEDFIKQLEEFVESHDA